MRLKFTIPIIILCGFGQTNWLSSVQQKVGVSLKLSPELYYAGSPTDRMPYPSPCGESCCWSLVPSMSNVLLLQKHTIAVLSTLQSSLDRLLFLSDYFDYFDHFDHLNYYSYFIHYDKAFDRNLNFTALENGREIRMGVRRFVLDVFYARRFSEVASSSLQDLTESYANVHSRRTSCVAQRDNEPSCTERATERDLYLVERIFQNVRSAGEHVLLSIEYLPSIKPTLMKLDKLIQLESETLMHNNPDFETIGHLLSSHSLLVSSPHQVTALRGTIRLRNLLSEQMWILGEDLTITITGIGKPEIAKLQNLVDVVTVEASDLDVLTSKWPSAERAGAIARAVAEIESRDMRVKT